MLGHFRVKETVAERDDRLLKVGIRFVTSESSNIIRPIWQAIWFQV